MAVWEERFSLREKHNNEIPAKTKLSAVMGFMATNPGMTRLSDSFPRHQPVRTIPPPKTKIHPSHCEERFNQWANPSAPEL